MIGALGKGMLTIADGPEMPSVDDFLPDPFVFQGTPFAINRIILVRILATVIMLLVLGITASRAKLIPSRWQGCERHRGLDHDPVHGMQGRGAYRPDRHGSRTSGVMAARHGRRPLARPQRICAGGSEMSNAYERRGAQLNMESLYIRHDVISERKLARLNPDRPVSFRADQAVSRFGTTLGRCPLGLRSSVTHRHF